MHKKCTQCKNYNGYPCAVCMLCNPNKMILNPDNVPEWCPLMKNKLEVASVKCPICEDVIFSRARHDMRFCTCGKTTIDGGFDYVKLSFSSQQKPLEITKLPIKQTKAELFQDWNSKSDKFGLIKNQS